MWYVHYNSMELVAIRATADWNLHLAIHRGLTILHKLLNPQIDDI